VHKKICGDGWGWIQMSAGTGGDGTKISSPCRPLIYTSPISTIALSHKVCQQQYADDTQLYVALSPVNYNHDFSVPQSCLTSL